MSPTLAVPGPPATRGTAPLNKTLEPADLRRPEVAAAARSLRRTARWLAGRRIPFAVNGVLRWRWRVRWHKLWEYSRGVAYGGLEGAPRVLDFGGGATLPVFHLARRGCEVWSLDIDERLTAHANAVARARGWSLRGSTRDLTREEAPADWGTFDRVLSFCVLEHLPKPAQGRVMARLAALLRPGGIFALTFDYGEDAPVEGALRGPDEVTALVAASGLRPLGGAEFVDTGSRFRLDRKYPERRFTFGSLFLTKPAP